MNDLSVHDVRVKARQLVEARQARWQAATARAITGLVADLPVGGKVRERTVEGRAGEQVRFLERKTVRLLATVDWTEPRSSPSHRHRRRQRRARCRGPGAGGPLIVPPTVTEALPPKLSFCRPMVACHVVGQENMISSHLYN